MVDGPFFDTEGDWHAPSLSDWRWRALDPETSFFDSAVPAWAAVTGTPSYTGDARLKLTSAPVLNAYSAFSFRAMPVSTAFNAVWIDLGVVSFKDGNCDIEVGWGQGSTVPGGRGFYIKDAAAGSYAVAGMGNATQDVLPVRWSGSQAPVYKNIGVVFWPQVKEVWVVDGKEIIWRSDPFANLVATSAVDRPYINVKSTAAAANELVLGRVQVRVA